MALRRTMKQIIDTLAKLNRTIGACSVVVLCAATAITLPAQTFTTLLSFDGADGSNPFAGLVQATNGELYGTTTGTFFQIAPGGSLRTFHSFCSLLNCTDGRYPRAAPIQEANGDVYGTTYFGGAYNYYAGTIFKIDPSGTLTTLYSFCALENCADGANPYGGLVQATDGGVYGATQYGGAYSYGTIFKITPSGALTTLYSFCSLANCADGEQPYAGLIQAADGDLYGTTAWGGAHNSGTAFKIAPSGALTTIYSFCSLANCADGAHPYGGLTQAANGDLYGTTYQGGVGSQGNGSGGTVFRIAPGGALTTLYSFCSLQNCADGLGPYAGLIQATDGDLYGTTVGGGAHDGGAIFQITPSRTLTTVYSFCSLADCADGWEPYAGLVQSTNGDLYGTTVNGGTGLVGTVFRLSLGLGPFVEPQRTSGEVGSIIKILGTDLTGATGVTFNGTAATFTVVKPSLITATVPAGATTGTVQVVTPGGTLSSNVPFRVLP
jgi:uncharacterized repeat protein (TIGR03803 family)